MFFGRSTTLNQWNANSLHVFHSSVPSGQAFEQMQGQSWLCLKQTLLQYFATMI